MDESISVLIVDDHPLFLQGMRDTLETDRSIKVVASATDGEMALAAAIAHRPDVVLVDINLPTINGLQVTREIKSALSSTQVITITGYDDAQQMAHAFRAGASAYCAKDIEPEKLINTIRSVNRGYYTIDGREMSYDEMIAWLDEHVGQPGSVPGKDGSSFVTLSTREMEILEHVTRGLSNKEIAYELGISHQTVKNHMTAILRKLRVDDRTQAAVYALRNGWVRLSPG